MPSKKRKKAGLLSDGISGFYEPLLIVLFGRKPRDMASDQTSHNLGYEDRVSCWIPPDGGAIHVKVVTIPHHDPVEMNVEQARDFAKELLKLADELGDN